MNHRLHHFMQQLTDEMSANYKEIQEWASTDPGTAGDQGEENWAKWLREWLPPTYQVVTKGQIINHEGKASRQIDVLVLKPFYPKRLHSEKRFFSAGVAAAFECKTTLKASHIDEATQICVELKNLYPSRTGSPYKELHTPIAYGLLAHSHDWKGENSTPIDNINKYLRCCVRGYVSHPRLGLDFLCVADLDAWSLARITCHDLSQIDLSFYKKVTVSYFKSIASNRENREPITAIGSFYAHLMNRLAWEDPTLRDIADYYEDANINSSRGDDPIPQLWDFSAVYSETVTNQIMRGYQLIGGRSWDEWKHTFGVLNLSMGQG